MGRMKVATSTGVLYNGIGVEADQPPATTPAEKAATLTGMDKSKFNKFGLPKPEHMAEYQAWERSSAMPEEGSDG